MNKFKRSRAQELPLFQLGGNFKIAFVFMLFLLFNSFHMQAQQNAISGTVYDNTGETVIGASVKVKNGSIGTITDMNGKFTLANLKTKTTVEVSYMGFDKLEIVLAPGVNTRIVLKPKETLLSEVVVVGYGTQKKINVTGALATVSTQEMLKSPVVNASQALVGRVSGVFSRQISGQPGNDDASFKIRGSGTYNSTDAMVVVDGVERDFKQLDMNEIESMTVLKDAASTAVYGVRGANGVIVVTTKQGKEGPAKVSYTGNFGVNTPINLPKFVNSYDYALLRNEAELNDNSLLKPEQLSYSAQDIEMYKNGTDPVFYPNVDWYKMIMKNYSTQQQHNVNISGGSKFARYYVSLGYQSQDGLYKNFNKKFGYTNNDEYKRYNVRTNLDVNLTSTTKLNFSLGTITGIKNRDRSNGGYPTLYQSIPGTAALYSPGFSDDKLVYLDGRRYSNLIQSMSSGFIKYTDNSVQTTAGLNQKLDFITKGLSARAMYSYDTRYVYNVERSRSAAVYILKDTIIDNKHEKVYTLYQSKDESIGGLSETKYSSRRIKEYFETGLQYARSFGKHNTSALFLYNQNKTRFEVKTPVGVPNSYLGLVGRMTYNFDSRYFMEFNLGYNGSENFDQGRRFGFFPAISGGWVVSDERFFKSFIPERIISHLKLRVSYGEVGNDGDVNRFLYLPSAYKAGDGALMGEDFKKLGSYYEDKLGNPLITWEKAKKQNYGIDMKFFKQRLNLIFDYFYDSRNDILDNRKTLPAMFGATPATENLGEMINKGFEIDLGWNDKVGKVSYFVKGNYSFARNKILYTDESYDVLNPHLARTGRRYGQPFGYKFIGFFADQNDVAQSPSQFSGASLPGDAKYADINGDGVINEKDMVPIGYPTFPEVNFGLSGGMSYKGFDFSFLFQGATNVSIMIDGFMQKPGAEFGQILESVKYERWTPGSTTATRPRLTVNYANASNYMSSTLWQRDASYLRLKNVELGYNIERKALKSIGISNLKVYVNGQNLYTWDKLDIADPENGKTSDLQYPQLVIYNVGVKVSF